MLTMGESLSAFREPHGGPVHGSASLKVSDGRKEAGATDSGEQKN
jgi:hypothetical protein